MVTMQPELSTELDHDLSLARTADQEALGRLFESRRTRATRYAANQLSAQMRRRVSAEDVVQRAVVRCVLAFDQFTGETACEFDKWFMSILNRAIGYEVKLHYTAHKRSVQMEEGWSEFLDDTMDLSSDGRHSPKLSDPADLALRAEAVAELLSAMSQLPPSQAEAIRLAHLEGLSYAQVGQRIDRSEQAVAGLIKRGLRALRANGGDLPCLAN